MHSAHRLFRSHKSTTPLLAVLLSASVLLGAEPTAPSELAALRAEIAQLQARLEALETSAVTTTSASIAAATSENAVVTVDRRGLVVQSADKSFSLRVRPRIQIDGAWFSDDSDGTNNLSLRRVRPTIQGTAGPLAYRFMPELAGTVRILDAWGDLRFDEGTFLRMGKFKGVTGLERLQSFSRTLFIERGLPSVVTPTREIGAELHGWFSDGWLEWTLGLYDGTLDDTDLSTNTNFGDDFDLGARLALHPFTGFTIGVAATLGEESITIDDTDRDRRLRYRTSGRNTFFRYADGVLLDGNRARLNAFASWYRGPISVLTEWIRSSYEVRLGDNAETVATDAFTAQFGWVLTGENASYDGVRPKHPFAPANDHWGALELGLRYHLLEVGEEAFNGANGVRYARSNATQRADAFGLGINWILTDNLLFALNYEITDFSGKGAARDTEKVVLTRFQVDF